MKTLVAGWFSFEEGQATAGDVLAAELACDWLEVAGHRCDLAVVRPFRGGVDWRGVDPAAYDEVVFVCGPFQDGPYEREFLGRFAGKKITGLDLTMATPLDAWNPFDHLFERDSSATVRPAITFLSKRPTAPVVGVCLVEDYPGAMVGVANEAIGRLLGSVEAAVVPIDTRLDCNTAGLRSPAEIEALLARMDLVVTTRMHGTVLALKHGVPVVAIDPEAGGAKLLRQARVIGWPVVFIADALDDAALRAAFDYCLTDSAKADAIRSGQRATGLLLTLRDQFLATLKKADADPIPDPSREWPVGPTRITVGPITAPPPAETPSRPGPPASDLRRLARKVVPAPARRALQAIRRSLGPAAGIAPLPRSVTPVSREWGYDRGRPVDRYYIEEFLARRSSDVRGLVLEVGDPCYTRRFGGDRVEAVDVLDVAGGNPAATIVADLSDADQIPSDRFDCIIFTQTLHLIYDVPAAIRTLRRILKPGGVLLATVPSITRISHHEWGGSWYWGFSSNSARRLFGDAFPADDLAIESFGNVLAASAFLYGFAEEDLRRPELDFRDPEYEVIITVRAVKARGDRLK